MPFSEKILRKTTSEIRTFLDELANGTTTYRTVHSLTRQIEHQYHERFVIELIQNAHDVLNRQSSKAQRIDICLDGRSGPHGALYVANDGRQFRDEDFESVARLGQSTKNPNDSAGNKGIGFRSVLEVCDAPEVYSCASDRRGVFDGYGFRFDPAVLISLRGPIEALLEAQDEPLWEFGGNRCTLQGLRVSALRSRYRRDVGSLFKELELLSPYLLPVPAHPDEHARVSRYAEAGFATVVRLPFKDVEARDKAAARLRAIGPDVVLFLDALGTLTIHDGSLQRTFSRREKERVCDEEKRARDRSAAEIVISDGEGAERRFWSWRRPVGNDDAAEAERIRKAASKLPGKWPELSRAVVSVAVEVGDSPPEGLFFVFLPTTIPSGSGAHMNAPFYPTMDRKGIDFSEPLNKLLLSELDALTAEVILNDLQGKGTDEARAIVDLAAPRGGDENLETAVAERLQKRGLLGQSIILTDHGWKPATESRLLPVCDGALVLTSSALRDTATFAAVAESLASRRGQVERLIESMTGQPSPSERELASTVAAIAKRLTRYSDSPWDQFWIEVEELLPNAKSLSGHAVLLDAEGELRVASGQVPVFFSSADEGDDGSTVATSVPPELRSRIAFLSTQIPLHTKGSRGSRERTSTRSYLGKIVDRYDVDSIFTKVLLSSMPVQAVPLHSDEGRRCAATLGWAAQLVTGARNSGSFAHHLARLRLPCRGGWYVAGETAFGPGWGDTFGGDLDAYLEAADTTEAREERGRLLLPPEDPAWRGSATLLRDRLASMGVVDGLRPRPVAAERFGGEVRLGGGQPLELSKDPPPGVSRGHWAAYQSYLEPIVKREFTRFSRQHEYGFSELSWMPGLDDIERLSSRGRAALMRLLVRSIPRWRPDWTEAYLVKQWGHSDSKPVPSLLRFSLEGLPWLWIEPETEAADGSPAVAHGVAPKDRWYVAAVLERGRRRQFEHLQPLPPAIVRLIDRSEALDAIEKLGMPVYDVDREEQRSDNRLLTVLARAFEMKLVEGGIRDVFLGQVRAAWRQFHSETGDHLPEKVIVMQGARQISVVTPTEENPVYLPEPGTRYSAVGHFARIPVLVIDPIDARRLSVLHRRWGQGVRELSSLRLEPWVDGRPWASSGAAPRLEESDLQWLMSFTLAMAAFAGDGAHGAQTKKFQPAIAAMRAVRVESVEHLSVRVVKAGIVEGLEQPELAFWDANSSTLLMVRGRAGWLEALAEPLQRILDRGDLVTTLRLALSKLKDEPKPVRADIINALEAVHVSEHQLGEVEQRCVGDLPWVVERLEPAILLLAPEWDRSPLRVAGSVEEVAALLGKPLGHELADWLVQRAQSSRDDRAMGRALFDHLGQKAELDAWNHALGRLEPPRRAVVNPRFEEEFRDHLDRARTPLYALARYLCKNNGNVTFPELRSAIDRLAAPSELAHHRWEVPFAAVTQALSQVLASRGAPADAVAALEGSEAIDILEGYLEILDPSIEPHRNPIEIHGANHEACHRVLDRVRRAGIVWCRRSNRALGVWARSASELFALAEAELSTDGYLDIMAEEHLLALIARTVPHDAAHEEFWSAARDGTSLSDFLQRLGVTQSELSEADRLLGEVREQQRKQARMMNVYGQEFDSDEENWDRLRSLLEAKIPDDHIPPIELARPADLVSLVGDARRNRRVSSSGAGSGSKPRRISEEKRRMIGLIGEYWVYRVLRKAFGEKVITPSCWFSGDSVYVFPGNKEHVDDGCGCDFRF